MLDWEYIGSWTLGKDGEEVDILGVDPYRELSNSAKEEDRPIGNYIKSRLRRCLIHEQEDTTG